MNGWSAVKAVFLNMVIVFIVKTIGLGFLVISLIFFGMFLIFSLLGWWDYKVYVVGGVRKERLGISLECLRNCFIFRYCSPFTLFCKGMILSSGIRSFNFYIKKGCRIVRPQNDYRNDMNRINRSFFKQ